MYFHREHAELLDAGSGAGGGKTDTAAPSARGAIRARCDGDRLQPYFERLFGGGGEACGGEDRGGGGGLAHHRTARLRDGYKLRIKDPPCRDRARSAHRIWRRGGDCDASLPSAF